MVFVSDRQRKAFFGSFSLRTPNQPRIMKTKQPSRLTPEMKKFLQTKIRKNIKEGKPPRQAVAIAFNQARKKFPKSSKLIPKTNPHLALDQRTRRLLFLVFGTVVALSLLRQLRT